MSERLTTLKTVLWALVGVLASVTVVRFAHGLGSVTNLSDSTPWGLWIGFDVMSGVALAAGGFVLAATVYIFGLERYKPFVRAAILTALLGYAAVAVGLLYDLGLPWRIWHPMVNWQYHSVLFEVAMCVMLYLTVLFLEFLPVILEHKFFQGALFQSVAKTLKRVSILLVIAGIVLSTLHQSSLGSLFLITPYRLHPLWYSHIINFQFFVSAIGLGLMTVVLESLFSNYFLGHKIHMREISGLGLAASIVLWIYVAMRLVDLALQGTLGMALDGSWQSGLFMAELGVSAVIPALLMLFKPIRSSLAGVAVAATMVVFGMVMHRLDVSIVAFARPEEMGYFPSWEEFAVSFGIVAGGILIFLFFVENLNVFDDVRGHPPEPKPGFDPEAMRSFLPGPLSLPRRYSVAALGGAAVALFFLPVGGMDHQPVPTLGPRSVEVIISDGEEGNPRELTLAASAELSTTTRVLMLDANRNGEVVLFDHDDHAERLGQDRSCETCHHLTKPLDENTSCFECHSDMYEPRTVFDHDLHSESLGGNQGCVECHEREAMTAPTENPENLNRCMTCHDVDWRDAVQERMPRRGSGDRVAGGSRGVNGGR